MAMYCCGRKMKVSHVGAFAIMTNVTMSADGKLSKPGPLETIREVISCDTSVCVECGREVVAKFANEPIAVDYRDGAEKVAELVDRIRERQKAGSGAVVRWLAW